MPASTVNAMSTAQLASLSTEQLTSLINSPNYPLYTSLITSNIESQIENLSKITFAKTTSAVSKVASTSNLAVSVRFSLIYLIFMSLIYVF